jgi:hypothetical protein
MGTTGGGNPPHGEPTLDAFERQHLEEVRYVLWLDDAIERGEIDRSQGMRAAFGRDVRAARTSRR